jgi:hypothetical protein
LLPVASAVAQSDDFQTPPWLEFVEEIRIPNDQFSGIISDMSIDQAGNVLFNASSTPYLFSRRLNQLIKLDPEGCRPGADPRLPVSMFTPDGEIVAMFGTSFFWFNLAGKCVHYVSEKILWSGYDIAIPGRNMVFARDYTNPFTMEKMDVNGIVTKSTTIDKLPVSNIASRVRGGGLVFSNGRYYWANSMTNTVAAFDASFSPIWKKAIGMENLPFRKNDITDAESEDYFTHMPRILREMPKNAYVRSLHAVDRNTLILHVDYNKELYFQLFDHDGNAQKLLTTSGYVKHNPNSRLFFRYESDDELIVYVYRMK